MRRTWRGEDRSLLRRSPLLSPMITSAAELNEEIQVAKIDEVGLSKEDLAWALEQ